MPKNKVSLNRSEELTSVDDELDTAMERLAESNDRISDVLANIDGDGTTDPTSAADENLAEPDATDGAESQADSE